MPRGMTHTKAFAILYSFTEFKYTYWYITHKLGLSVSCSLQLIPESLTIYSGTTYY